MGEDLPTAVWYTQFDILGQKFIREHVMDLARSNLVGGTVQRVSAEKVFVRAASPFKDRLKSFLVAVGAILHAGLPRVHLAHKRDQDTITLAFTTFFTIATSTTLKAAAKGAVSDDPPDAISYVTPASQRSPRGL